MKQHDSTHTHRLRTFGLVALAVLVALVAAVSAWSAQSSASTTAPAATGQPAVFVQDTTPRETPPAAPERPDRDCPKDRGGTTGPSGTVAPSAQAPAPAL